MKKRVISLFMALVMCLSLVPTAVWAEAAEGVDNNVEQAGLYENKDENGAAEEQEPGEDGENALDSEEESDETSIDAVRTQGAENGIAVQAAGAVAEVTVDGKTTKYDDIDEAFAAAQEADSATVKLLADVTIPGGGYNLGIELNRGTITLDLNGKTIARKAGIQTISIGYSCFSVFYLNGEGLTLTIQDTSSEQSGRIVQPDGFPAVLVNNGASLTVTSGTIQNTSSEDYRGTYSSSNELNCAVMNCWASYTTINGGTLTGKRGVVVNTNSYNRGGRLTITGGTISGTDGNALLAYVASRVALSGGSFSTESNTHSIWVNESGNVKTMLAEECSYVQEDGTASNYSEDSKGVVGNTIVKAPVRQEIQYVDATGTVVTRNEFTEITADTTDLKDGWYAVKEDITIDGDLLVTGPQYVYLILCDGATLTVTGSVRLKNANYSLNIYGQSEHTGTLKAGSAESTVPAIAADASARSHLYIYGGTVTVQAKAGTHSIGETTGNGLSFNTGSEMKTVKTDNQNTYMHWYDDSGVSLTITKCKDHAWEYTDRGDRGHETSCALCKKMGNSTPHSYTGWTDNNDGTHTGTCKDCKAVKTEAHTPTFTPNADGLTHSGKCSKCGYAAGTENHNFDQTDEYGKKCKCGAYLAASYNGQNYTSLADAVEAAKDKGTVKLEKDVGENITVTDDMDVTIDLNQKSWTTDGAYAHPTLTVTGGSVTVKNGTLTSGASSNAYTTVEVEGGKLTVGENMTIQGGSMSEDVQYPAIEVKGGQLSLSKGTKLGFGMKVADEGKTLASYLPANTAFQQTDYDQGAATGTAKIIDGYVQEKVGNFTLNVVEHTTHTYDATTRKCECGFTCAHEKFSNGVCDTCGYVCAHPSDKVTEAADKTTCDVCREQMVVKVEKNDSTTYYAKHFEARYPYAEDTLREVFNKAPDDSTVTLLADDLPAFGWVTGKNITLNMNGKKLIENNGIVVDIDSDTKTGGRLFVSGEGSSTAPEGSMYPCTFRILDDSELVLNENFSGDYGTIYLEDGVLTSDSANMKISALVIQNSEAQVKLKGGQFGMIVTDGSITRTASSLLAKGYAFQQGDSYVAYGTEISQTSSLENVTVVKCEHEGLPSDFSGTACPYCNAELAATVKTKDGQINGYTEFTTALNAANAASGCTLTLLKDVSGNLTVKANVTIHLNPNSHTVSGTVTVQNNASLTATGGMFSGRVNCVGTLNLTGSNLTGDLSVNGNATLTSCSVGKAVAVNNGGTLTVIGGSLTDVTVNNGGTLTFQNGNISGTVTAKSGGTVTVSSGHIGTLTAENNATLTLSGGNFTKITVSGKNLIECLETGYAFQDSNGIVDGRTPILTNVSVEEHAGHSYAWNTTSHELVCACGDVEEKDTDEPLLYDSGNKLLEDGGSYYGDLIFTADEKNLATVTVDGNAVAAENDKYKIIADNKSHTIVASDLAGNTVSVVVNVYKVYNVTLASGTGYTVSGESTAKHGQDYTFTVTIAEGYSRVKGSYKVLVNGTEVNAGSSDENPEQFTVIATGNLTITVEGVADVTAPDVEMVIGTNTFKELLNSLTFGLFFKETQTVTVTATDLGSRVDDSTAAYLVADGPFDEKTMPTEGWTSFNMKGGEGSFSIEPNAKGSVYVRVTDNAGNVTVINSDGVVIYTDSEASINSITFTRLSKTDVAIAVDLKGNTVKSVFCDGIELNGTGYEVLYPSAGSGKTSGTIELKNMFLSNLAAGEYTITVEYKPMGETYKEAEGNEAPATTEVTLTVVKAERKLNFTAPNAIYDGKGYDGLTITTTGLPEGTTIQYQYKKQDADDSTYDTAAPKNAGSYTVKITVDADENYEAKDFTANFTISPKEVTISGATVENKTYDGNDNAKITEVQFAGAIEGETLTLGKDYEIVSAKFPDADADDGLVNVVITVKLKDTANYELKDGTYTAVRAAMIDKASSSVATAPTAKTDLVYNGGEQELVTAGTANGGTMQYSLDGKTWQDTVPTGKNADAYTVHYRVVGDKNHGDSESVFLTVTIARQKVGIPAADETEFTYNGKAQTYTIAESELYTVEGSVQTGAGHHTVSVTLKDTGNYVWEDGTDTAKTYDFTIARKEITITAKDKTAHVGDKAPDLNQPVLDKDYTVEGLVEGDTLDAVKLVLGGVTLEYVDDEGNKTDPDMSQTGEVTIRVTASVPEVGNYTPKCVDGKLIITKRSSYYYAPSGDAKEQSPGTGDAGMLVYGLTALGGYTGTALVLRRRKRED